MSLDTAVGRSPGSAAAANQPSRASEKCAAADVANTTPAELTSLVRDQLARYGKAIRDNNITAD